VRFGFILGEKAAPGFLSALDFFASIGAFENSLYS
jgi:hypothetical protein